MPYLIYLPSSYLNMGIYTCLTIRNLLSIPAYPVLLILIKDSAPSSAVLGKINGLASSAGAACRMVAPPVSGYLYALGSRVDCTGLAWYGSVLVAGIGAIQCFCVKRQKKGDEYEKEEKVKKIVPSVKITEVEVCAAA